MSIVRRWFAVRYHEKWCFRDAKRDRTLLYGLVKAEGSEGGGLFIKATLYESDINETKGARAGSDVTLGVKSMEKMSCRQLRKALSEGGIKVDKFDEDAELKEEPESTDDESDY
ncbi:unnamed protein product [Vitrella brassicaformis CCMP3155]|uniref:Uncharacterized protein n=1 Tax=Vitrella brassicaformis (strain CCMP3155) TaxID=1169540 RepID=A0A0G4GGF7_VITBC|nr:unnamed protein product [Vitrella brassicaformis CCMP3155]|eukprot:CEM28707.1 unnamed protein product [Vitrella brassicaformis CCMP3155]